MTGQLGSFSVPLEIRMGEEVRIELPRNREYPDYWCELTYASPYGGGIITSFHKGGYVLWKVPDFCAKSVNLLSFDCTFRLRMHKTLNSTMGTEEMTLLSTVHVPGPSELTADTVDCTIGQTYLFSCKRKSEYFHIKAEFLFHDLTVLIDVGPKDAFHFTPGYELAAQIPEDVHGVGTLKCTTYNGITEVGTNTVDITINVPNNELTRPIITQEMIALSPIGDLGDSFSGLFIRGKTGLRADFSAKSEYSRIDKYQIVVGEHTAEGNPAIVDMLTRCPRDTTVQITVTDARGYSSTVQTVITVYQYIEPRLIPYKGYSEIICERALDTGELNPNGTYLAVKAGKKYTEIKPEGTELNQCTLRYRSKIASANSFGEWNMLLAGDSVEKQVSLLISDVVSSINTSYTVEIVAEDSLGGTDSMVFEIMTAEISFVLYDGVDGAGFGKYPEEPHVVDIAPHMTLLVRGKLKVLGTRWESLGLADLVSVSEIACGRAETSGCFYLVSEEKHVYVAFNCSFDYEGNDIVINKDPIPLVYRPIKSVYSLCPLKDRSIAMVHVDSYGYIHVEWVQKINDTVLTGNTEVTWIDGYLDYWI